jgi:Xaa-Pro aminopeptidase
MTIVQEKIAQAKSLLREFDIDCWVTFVRESDMNGDPILQLIAGIPLTWHSALIVDRSGGSTAIVGRYDRNAVEDLQAYAKILDYVQGARALVQDHLRALGPRTIALNYSENSEISDGITHGMFLTLTRWLGEIGMGDRIVSAEPVVSALRQRKTPTELAAIRKAVQEAEVIFRSAAAAMRIGMSEAEIAEFMRSERVRKGFAPAWDDHTCPAVFSGPEAAEAHYHPTERRVEGGHLVSMDFGVRTDGYCSDLQRIHYALRPGEEEPPEAVHKGFATLVSAIEAARLAMKPGVQGTMVDAAARETIVAAGYPEFPHALGHQVGRYAHDGTALLGPLWEKYADKPLKPLEEGMVFTLEPRLPVAGHGIVTIEEMVVVTATGADYLSTPQKEIRLIRPTR